MEKAEKKRVLVVEDDEDVITYLSLWLSDQGFDVDVARDGNEATEKVKQRTPDLVTLDIVMPQKTGVKFYKEFKRDPRYVHIPVIIITGLQQEFKRFISHRRTAPPPEGYIAKPFSQEELLETIRRVLDEAASRSSEEKKKGNCA